MRWYKTLITLVLCCCLLAMPATPVAAWSEYPTGDIDNGGTIDASDALMALQYSVNLTELTGRRLLAADVNGDGEINASDALLILQYSVGLIAVFPNDMTGEEKYYAMRDSYYSVTGEDFIDNGEADLEDVEALLETYGQTNEPSDVETAQMTWDGKLIYTPISDEAAKTGQLNKYDNAEKVTGTLELDGTVLNYSIPKRVTAYDAVPIEYSITSAFPLGVHFEATTFEETDRYADPNGNYYDCNLLGNPDLEITYNGYVTGNEVPGYSPNTTADLEKVTQGTRYPGYETSDLIKSGTMPAGDDYLWLNFTFKNTGDTILDPEGSGSFMFEPILYRKNDAGNYERIYFISTDNRWERLYDYLYPGESGNLWLLCYTNASASSYSYTPGDYRLTLRASARSERNGANWIENFVQGRYILDASFDFTVTEEGAMTEPNPIQYQYYDVSGRNSWLGSFEEFQSSYQLLSGVSNDVNQPTTGIMYVQPAPWNETISLKIMHGDLDGIATVQIPIEVESDSLSIELNPYNENYVIKEDGTREPALISQSMVDMRGNVQMGPDSLGTAVNDLRNMKEAGINLLTSTMSSAYNSGNINAKNAFKFMMDAVRVMGFSFEGFSHYPYNYNSTLSAGAWIGGGRIPDATISSFGYSGMNQANGLMAKFTLARYGDLFWVRGDGVLPIAAEDTRGWMTIDHDWRFGIRMDASITQYRNWLQSIYSDINELNAAYGSSYSSFDEIDPRTEGEFEETHMGAYTHLNSTGVFQEGSRAMAELDVYRTLARISDYKEMFETAAIQQEDTRIWIRYEGSTYFAPGIDPNTTNSVYRQFYYEQRRNAVIPEILAASNVVFGGSNYDWWAIDPSEIYELTKHSTQAGFTTARMFTNSQQRDIVINSTYGESKYVKNYNLADTSLKGALVMSTRALYPALKATYEGGGIPGVLWQDYHCDGFITSTQFKELKFYTSKIQEMLQTEDGKEWAADFEAPARDFEVDSQEIWSYPKEYIEQVLADTPRDCHFDYPYVD